MKASGLFFKCSLLKKHILKIKEEGDSWYKLDSQGSKTPQSGPFSSMGYLASQLGKVQGFYILNGGNKRVCVYLCSAPQLAADHDPAVVFTPLPQSRCLFDCVRLN